MNNIIFVLFLNIGQYTTDSLGQNGTIKIIKNIGKVLGKIVIFIMVIYYNL